MKVAVHPADGFEPVTLSALRFLLGGAALWAMLRIRGGTLPGERGPWARALLVGLFGSLVPMLLYAYGSRHGQSTVAAAMNGTEPFFTALLAHRFVGGEGAAGDRLTGRRMLGILLGMAGVALLAFRQVDSLGRLPPRSTVLFFMLAPVSYAISNVLARKHLTGFPPLVAPAMQILVSAAVLLPVALLWEGLPSRLPSAEAAGSLLWLALLGTAVASALYYRILERSGATYVSLVKFLLPPLGAVLGVLLLGEPFGPFALGGLALVLAGLAVVQRPSGTAMKR